MDDYEPEDLANPAAVVFVVATYENGTPPDNAKFMYEWMEDASKDWRIGQHFLARGRFAIFGVGDSLYEANYNLVSINMEKYLKAMGGKAICPRGEGDNSVSRDKDGTAETDLEEWIRLDLFPGLERKEIDPTIKEHEFEYDDGEEEEEKGDSVAGDEDGTEAVVDLEDLGVVMGKQKLARIQEEEDQKKGILRPMINDTIKKNLTKQGYKIIGSHSGVKLCRWTKAMLRGRGGCYKHTFYGIASYQCMEMTPSLACANKCVFW